MATRPSSEAHIAEAGSAAGAAGAGGTGSAGSRPKTAEKASWRWKAGAVLVAVLTIGTVWLVTGVVGTVYGAADNGDGPRLTCPSGLLPDTPSQRWNGQIGVVHEYQVGEGQDCWADVVYPTTRRLLLNALVPDTGTFSLRKLAAVESSMLGVVVGCGVLLLRRWGRPGMCALAVIGFAAVAPAMSRFFMSPFSESAGLVGSVALLIGAAGLLANPVRAYAERFTSVALVLFGAAYGGLAKQANLPLIGVGVAVLLCTRLVEPRPFRPRRVAYWARLVLPRLVSLGMCAALLVPAAQWYKAGETWSRELNFNELTTGDFVLGAVALEVQRNGGSLADLGLPESFGPLVGMEEWPDQDRKVQPDWQHYFKFDIEETRARTAEYIARNPEIGYRLLTTGIAATQGVRNNYLAAYEFGGGPDKGKIRITMDTPYVAVGAVNAAGNGAVGFLLLSGLTVLGPVRYANQRFRRRIGPEPGRGHTPTTGLLLLAAVSAALALTTCAVAVWGDGYYELTKHVWLGAFFAAVAVGLAGVAGAGPVRRRLSRIRRNQWNERNDRPAGERPGRQDAPDRVTA
ncbi:glycan biosynthesis hexose transferase WsfD [Yinghuangia soli]|uniref:Uncharacterized protein n=1 Tax=Yinghuangia soli TaxID=2908204 RepID=A0AA41Q2K3_9ACTN|nr:hypothetical protein [Yinghuangia soli]MCF2530389.1 hypothetical protein [Yinghuangia soli]